MQYASYGMSAISLIINVILALRLFNGDNKKNSSQQTELIVGMRNIEKCVSNIDTKIENLITKVDEDHDALIRLQESQKQLWKTVNSQTIRKEGNENE
jgi:hypothetical protein